MTKEKQVPICYGRCQTVTNISCASCPHNKKAECQQVTEYLRKKTETSKQIKELVLNPLQIYESAPVLDINTRATIEKVKLEEAE